MYHDNVKLFCIFLVKNKNHTNGRMETGKSSTESIEDLKRERGPKFPRKATLSILFEHAHIAIVTAFSSPSCLDQKTAKGPSGLRVKLQPVYHTRWRLHTVPLIAERKRGTCTSEVATDPQRTQTYVFFCGSKSSFIRRCRSRPDLNLALPPPQIVR